MPLDSPPPSEATRLCTSCGLCCDGTVFSVVPLKDGESPSPALTEGARWRDTPQKPAFLLPCHAFVGKCGIYGERPQLCMSFRCLLLRRAEAGELSWERAHELVRIGKERRDALREAIARTTGEAHPGDSLHAEMARVHRLREEGETETQFRRRMGEVMVAFAALRHLMREHFHRRRGTAGDTELEGGMEPPAAMPTPADPDGGRNPLSPEAPR